MLGFVVCQEQLFAFTNSGAFGGIPARSHARRIAGEAIAKTEITVVDLVNPDRIDHVIQSKAVRADECYSHRHPSRVENGHDNLKIAPKVKRGPKRPGHPVNYQAFGNANGMPDGAFPV